MCNKKLIEEWLNFRKLKLEELTNEDRTYVLEMDKLFKSIQSLVSNEEQKIYLIK